jgi:hypothetical protein
MASWNQTVEASAQIAIPPPSGPPTAVNLLLQIVPARRKSSPPSGGYFGVVPKVRAKRS